MDSATPSRIRPCGRKPRNETEGHGASGGGRPQFIEAFGTVVWWESSRACPPAARSPRAALGIRNGVLLLLFVVEDARPESAVDRMMRRHPVGAPEVPEEPFVGDPARERMEYAALPSANWPRMRYPAPSSEDAGRCRRRRSERSRNLRPPAPARKQLPGQAPFPSEGRPQVESGRALHQAKRLRCDEAGRARPSLPFRDGSTASCPSFRPSSKTLDSPSPGPCRPHGITRARISFGRAPRCRGGEGSAFR